MLTPRKGDVVLQHKLAPEELDPDSLNHICYKKFLASNWPLIPPSLSGKRYPLQRAFTLAIIHTDELTAVRRSLSLSPISLLTPGLSTHQADRADDAREKTHRQHDAHGVLIR